MCSIKLYIHISKLFTFLAMIAVTAFSYNYDRYSCPDFNEWGNWTDQCLWFPLSDIRSGVIQNCDINITGSLPNLPTLPVMPPPCGHCSFKTRCRKRNEQYGCFAIDIESQQCNNEAAVCNMPKLTNYNLSCAYEFGYEYLKQCSARADLRDWMKDGLFRTHNMMPDINCIEKDNQCFCCCHPYAPNEEGTECIEIEDSQCEDWNEWNDWSRQCVWLSSDETKETYSHHCDFDIPMNEKSEGLQAQLEEALDPVPDRCGFCSYRIKCRKRSKLDKNGRKSCFPIEVEKKACGNHDGHSYGEVCDFPKYHNSCNYTEALTRNGHSNKMSLSLKKLPTSMRTGLLKIIALMPHGDCREVGDRCKCCCHPYTLSDDANSCILKDFCKSTQDFDNSINLNLD